MLQRVCDVCGRIAAPGTRTAWYEVLHETRTVDLCSKACLISFAAR